MAEQRSYTGSFDNRWKFNGKELDEETGLYYYGARFYNPSTSLWLSVDPLVEQTMDAYGYCYQNPIMLVDPDGKSPRPGDLFNSIEEAAENFGHLFFNRSVSTGFEYTTTIYSVIHNGATYYAYTQPEEGGVNSGRFSPHPDQAAVAHTHGRYEFPDNLIFSPLFEDRHLPEVDSMISAGDMNRSDVSNYNMTAQTSQPRCDICLANDQGLPIFLLGLDGVNYKYDPANPNAGNRGVQSMPAVNTLPRDPGVRNQNEISQGNIGRNTTNDHTLTTEPTTTPNPAAILRENVNQN
jgi:RHS repeat-associated protein